MKNTFCTIITADYYPYALALYKSLRKYDPSVSLQVLVADNKAVAVTGDHPGMNIIPVSSLENYSLVNSLYRKYAHINPDFFRWSLKPVFMSYLFEQGFDKVLFSDCDIFFFDSYNFLFEELDRADFLLTPHWYNSNPLTDEVSFTDMLTKGIFNAGFIGANRGAKAILEWWANACHFKMGVIRELGIADDQRYLDVVPVKFENAAIIRHRGCNLSAGYMEECRRTLVDGTVLINGRYPVVFIHFTAAMGRQIMQGYDPLLVPYFEEFKKVFEEEGARLGGLMKGLNDHVQAHAIIKLRWRLKLRTRVKRILYRLSQKL